MSHTSNYLTMSAAARRLGISIDTCRRKFDDGELVGVRTTAGYRLVDPDSLEQRPRSFLTVTEAARLLDRSEVTVRTWFDTGRLRGFRTPAGHRRIDPEGVDEILEEAS